MAERPSLPIIDLSGYMHPESAESKEQVVTQVCDACRRYGFFQIKCHGVPLEAQRKLFQSLGAFFSLPVDEKLKLSFLQNPCRRGYEASGMSLREGDALPDAKECFYIGRDDPTIEPPGFYGPNVWPDLPDKHFRAPVWEYYGHSERLARTLWGILLQGLGSSADLLSAFSQRPIVPMKMIRYPPQSTTLPDQFGIGAHTDFGGITVLLQQPGREGLEVWDEATTSWLSVPATEDVLVINCGDMVQRWSQGRYKSARHRVINKSEQERLSCAMFWHGDVGATNPFNPHDPSEETVGKLLVKRFERQYSLKREVYMADAG
ncbi:2OG-Fe(II) oxygenase [Poronia punctata]|nr:2OG-Fe(II) oxygenase [Poronia punctata]